MYIKSFLPEINDFLQELGLKVYTAGPRKVKQPTEPKPFNLATEKIVRKVLAPEKVRNFFLK